MAGRSCLCSFDATATFVAALHGPWLTFRLGENGHYTKIYGLALLMLSGFGLHMFHSRFIDIAAEIVIVYAWTHDLWFWVAYAFILFSFDATAAFVAAIHGVRRCCHGRPFDSEKINTILSFIENQGRCGVEDACCTNCWARKVIISSVVTIHGVRQEQGRIAKAFVEILNPLTMDEYQFGIHVP
nr:hypothetical protein [Tanacetum cinerariifolium]